METSRHIYLVGFMGCGKSTVGPLLAERLQMPSLDLDRMIEGIHGASIEEIFAAHGEDFFRRIETSVLATVEVREPSVVALGGGAFCSEENKERVRRSGLSIWIDIPLQVALQRCLGEGGRPLARDPDRFSRLYRSRRVDYRQCDLHVQAEGLSPQQLASLLAKKLSAARDNR